MFCERLEECSVEVINSSIRNKGIYATKNLVELAFYYAEYDLKEYKEKGT